jgi:hypothetical protein
MKVRGHFAAIYISINHILENSLNCFYLSLERCQTEARRKRKVGGTLKRVRPEEEVFGD